MRGSSFGRIAAPSTPARAEDPTILLELIPINCTARSDTFISYHPASLAAGSNLISATQELGHADIPARILELTGECVPIVGLGGWTIGQPKISESLALKIIHASVDQGMRFMDNCWEYNDGRSE